MTSVHRELNLASVTKTSSYSSLTAGSRTTDGRGTYFGRQQLLCIVLGIVGRKRLGRAGVTTDATSVSLVEALASLLLLRR